MKIRLAALLAVLALGTGCYTVDIYAPKGAEVYLLPKSAPVQTKRQWKTWYAVFGLAPMDDTMPGEIIAREKLVEVRIDTIDTIPDLLIGIFYNLLFPIGLGTQSLSVSGNSAPAGK